MQNQMNRHHAAFRAKLDRTDAVDLERREAPSISDVTDALDKIYDGVERFKAEQRQKLELLETRMSRPGAFAPVNVSPNRTPTLIDMRTGKPVLEIRRGDDIASMYRTRGLIGGAGSQDEAPSLGDFLRAVAGQKSSPLAQKALSVGTDSAGGHLVPSALMPTVLSALSANSSLMEAGTRLIPMDDYGTGDAAKTYTFGAVNALPTAAWRAEGGAIAESDPTFRAIVATPRSLAFYFRVSRELLADALNMDTVLAQIMGQSIAEALDRAGLIGSGTPPEPRGVRNVAGISAVTNGANGASLATTRFANLMSATQALLNANGGLPTAAIMAPRTLVGFGSLADSTGQPLQRPDLLRNVQMIPTAQLPVNLTVGTSTDCTEIFVGNFARTAWVLRETFSIQRLNEPFALNGQIGFVAHVRADFVVEYPATLALVTGVRP
jgi:HK97 family phage major capsid protein